MNRSAVAAVVLASAALLLFFGCGPSRTPAAKAADAELKRYYDAPGEAAYQDFLKANGVAAREHGDPDDAAGVEYRLRVLEVQASEAERAKDQWLSEQVTSQVDALERSGADANLEEALPGAKKRLLDAKARAARVN